ncbi:MAG: PilZ domain-containing protein [Prochlorococcaceae cyanobacterium]
MPRPQPQDPSNLSGQGGRLRRLLQQDVRTLFSGATPAAPRQERKAVPSAPRSHERMSAPIGPSAIGGRIQTPEGESFPVKLWDVSDGGVCLHSRHRLPLAPRDPVTLQLLGTQSGQQVALQANIQWVEETAGGSMHFLGLRFADPGTNLRDTFLRSLLHSS